MYAGIGQRGNTIDKTTDILRKFRQEEGNSQKKDACNESHKDRFRLAALYGANVKRVRNFRGRRQPKQKGDDRDFAYPEDTFEELAQIALDKFLAAPLLSEEGVRRLESTVTSSRLGIFDLIHQFNVHYRVSLTREEAASLVRMWGCRVGPSHHPMVDYTKVLKKLIHLAEKQKTLFKAARKTDYEEQSQRINSMIDKNKLHLTDVQSDLPESHPEVEHYKAGAGLIQLSSALKKLNKAVKKAYRRDKKGFLAIVNSTDRPSDYSNQGGKAGGGGGSSAGGEALTVQSIRDFAWFNLGSLKLSIEEAMAILMHIAPNAYNCESRSARVVDRAFRGTKGNRNAVPLDSWLKELKLIAMGVHSRLSPIEVEIDTERKATPAKERRERMLRAEAEYDKVKYGGRSPKIMGGDGDGDGDGDYDYDDETSVGSMKGGSSISSNAARSKREQAVSVVDEFQEEVLINDFKRLNSPVRSQYSGILIPLGTPAAGATREKSGMSNSANASVDTKKKKDRMNSNVIIPIPDNLKAHSLKPEIPVEVKMSHLAVVDPRTSKRRAPAMGWENLDDDTSLGESVSTSAGEANSVGSYNYSTVRGSVLSGYSRHSKHAGSIGSRFIRLGKDKPVKSAAIGRQFAEGHELNKRGNVVIRYNKHSSIANAPRDDDGAMSVNTQGSHSVASSKRNRGVYYQKNKHGLYEGHAEALAMSEVVREKKDAPEELDDFQRNEVERLAALAEKRALDEEEKLRIAAKLARERWLSDELDRMQKEAAEEFAEMKEETAGALSSEQRGRMKDESERIAKIKAEREEDEREIKEKLAQLEAEEVAAKAQDKVMMEKLKAERRFIQEMQSARSQGLPPPSPTKASSDDASADGCDAAVNYDPNNPHRPGSPLNPYRGNMEKPRAVAKPLQGDRGLYADDISDLGSNSLQSNGNTSYAELHKNSKAQVKHILKHKRIIARDEDATSSADYSFHLQKRSKDSVATGISSLTSVPDTAYISLYGEDKMKQRYDVNFQHVAKRKELERKKVVVERTDIQNALRSAHNVKEIKRQAREKIRSRSPSPTLHLSPPVPPRDNSGSSVGRHENRHGSGANSPVDSIGMLPSDAARRATKEQEAALRAEFEKEQKQIEVERQRKAEQEARAEQARAEAELVAKHKAKFPKKVVCPIVQRKVEKKADGSVAFAERKSEEISKDRPRIYSAVTGALL